jgi:hypothetical protein
MEILRKIWHAWKRFGQMMGDFMARIVLTIFYFTLFAPFGLGVRLLSDPLSLKSGRLAWLERSTKDRTINDARRLS